MIKPSIYLAIDVSYLHVKLGAACHQAAYVLLYCKQVGRVNEYQTMHYFGIPRHTQSMIAYMILTEYFWEFQGKIALWECC